MKAIFNISAISSTLVYHFEEGKSYTEAICSYLTILTTHPSYRRMLYRSSEKISIVNYWRHDITLKEVVVSDVSVVYHIAKSER